MFHLLATAPVHREVIGDVVCNPPRVNTCPSNRNKPLPFSPAADPIYLFICGIPHADNGTISTWRPYIQMRNSLNYYGRLVAPPKLVPELTSFRFMDRIYCTRPLDSTERRRKN